jgi:hypothetical protein
MNAAYTHSYLSTKGIITTALFLVLAALTACKRPKSDPLQQGWKMVGNELLPHTPLLQQAEESTCIWQASQTRGQVVVSREGKFQQRPQEIRVETPQGVLIGTDHGEWGGTLTLSKGKGDPPKKILDEDVLQIIPTRKGFLIITGSLPRNEGTLWLYPSTVNHESTIEKKADLHGYPMAIPATTSGIWLANGDSIICLMTNSRFRTLSKCRGLSFIRILLLRIKAAQSMSACKRS